MKAFTITILALILVGLLLGLAPPARAATVGDPFTGTPLQINGMPGAATLIEAENFDKGGEGVAYHDPHSCSAPPAGTTCSCPPGAYRPDGVNVCASGDASLTVPTGPGYYVSYDDAGLWVEYTVQVSVVGNYTVELLVAFAADACCAAAAYHVELNGARATGIIPLGPKLTAGWTTFEWRGKSELIGMVPGIHRLRIVVDHGWFNWDAIRVRYAAGIEWQTVPVWKEYVK